MIGAGLLHGATWHWHLVAWTLCIVFLVAGWLGSMLVNALFKKRRGDLVERSLFAFGPAAVMLLVALLVLRLVERLHTPFGPGPQHWLVGWVPQPVSAAVGIAYVHPYDTIVTLNVLGAGLVAAVAVVAALVSSPKRKPPPLNAPVHGGRVASGILAVVSIALPFLFFHVYKVDTDQWWLLDLVSITPLIGLCLAARLQARIPELKKKREAPEEAPTTSRAPDIVRAWAKAGLVDPERAALVDWPEPSPATGATSARAKAAWEAADGPGNAPRALDVLLADVREADDAVWLLGDLPAETEHAVFTALLADVVGVQGMRVLAVVDRPQALAEAITAALEHCHTWEPGFVAVGAEALRESLARHRYPALVLVDPSDLSHNLIRLAADEGRLWTRGLDLLVVHRPDTGSPIDVTHTAFTFRRWDVATRDLSRPPVVATGADTAPVLAHLERLFPGRVARRLSLQPRSPGVLRALRANVDADAAADPWVARAARCIVDTGEAATLVDPPGTWGDLAIGESEVFVSRAIAYPHVASVADLDVRSLAAAFRAAPNRLDVPAGQSHFSLWNVQPSPVTRFLLLPGRLASLHAKKELPTPAPVVGAKNRFLRMAHLTAALHEGTPDEQSLRRAFGEDVVDFVLRQSERADTHVARVEGGVVTRSPLVRPTPGQTWRDPHRRTVTPDVISVVEDRSGRELARVDKRLAATRYYPKRVFAIGTRRYRVPLHTLDLKRDQLRVVPAAVRDALTRPLLRFDLEVRRVVVDAVTRRTGRLEVTTLTVEALVREQVLAAWVPGRDQEERFEPVQAEYDSEIRLIYPSRAASGPGLFHLAATLDDLLPAHLRTDDEDAEVVPLGPDFVPGQGPGVAVIDRNVGGMGIARALDEGTVMELLRWARATLYECDCMNGCKRCTPERVLRVGPAKQDVLAMLPAKKG